MSGERTERPQIGLYVLSGAVAASFMGLREGVGTDYYGTYMSGFRSALMGAESRYEPGFALLQDAIAAWTSNYNVFIFITSAIVVALVYFAIYHHSINPTLAVAVFLVGGLFFFSENAIRQGIASAILLNAIPYLYRGKPLTYFALVIFASLFHQVVIVMLPLYLLRNVKLGMILSLGILAVAGLLSGTVVPHVLKLGYSLSEQFALYATLDIYLVSNIDLTDIAYLGIALALCLYVSRWYGLGRGGSLSITWNVLVIGLAVALLTSGAFILYRVARLFSALLILIVPNMLHEIPGSRRNLLARQGYSVLLIALAVVLYGISGIDGVVPYEWCLW